MHEDGDRGGRSSLRGVSRLDRALARIRLVEKYPQAEIMAAERRPWRIEQLPSFFAGRTQSELV
jgi:hypothetical protein